MSGLIITVAILIAALTAIGLYRAAMGPSVFDRLIAVNWVGTNGVVLLVLTGFIFDRPDMFVDIAIAYALLNFVITIALLKFFESGGEEDT